MKYLSIIIPTMLFFNSYAQDKNNETSTADFKKVQIGINFSPDVCMATFHDTVGDVWNEKPKGGFTIGLNVGYNFKKFVGLEAGVQYSNKGYQTKKYNGGHLGPEFENNVYHFHYVDVPIKVNFTIGHRKAVRFFTSAGVTTNFLFKAAMIKLIPHKPNETTAINDCKTINVSPTVSVGFDWKINGRMNLRVEPTFRYGVLKVREDPYKYGGTIEYPFTTYLFNTGINISYYFGL